MRRMAAILGKEFRQIVRDPLSLGMLLALPALLLALYGYALSFDVKGVRTVMLDEDGTPESRRLLDGLFQNPYFERVGTLVARGEADRWLARGRAKVALVVPHGYAARLARGEEAVIQALVDGSDATTGNVVVGYLDALAERARARLAIERSGARAAGEGEGPAVTLEPRIRFNPDLVSARFLVPGLMALLLMLSAVVAASLSIVREKERGTLEQLEVSAVTPLELLAGKTLPYVGICLLTMALVLALGWLLFGVEVRGSFGVLAVTTFCFLFAALGMGLLISSLAHSQQEAFQVAMLSSLLPSIALSGFIFPIAAMPWPIQALTCLLAPRHFVSALRKVVLKGATLGEVWVELAALVALGLIFNALAAHIMRRARERA
jgi:ABC-2 type transport system permease protein